MHIQPLTYRKFIIGILAIVIIIIVVKLYNTIRKNGLEEFENIENFESILKKLKTNNKQNNNNSGSFKKKNTNTNTNTNNVKLKKKVTFEDLLKETEDMNVEKYSISNMKQNFFGYINSFKKDKFKNITGTTNESLEKFDYFK